MRFLTLALGVIMFTEIISFTLRNVFKTNPFVVYHIMLPLIYGSMALFFYQFIQNKKIKQALFLSVFVLAVFSYTFSICFSSPDSFPGLMINLQGLLIIGISLYVLLTLDPIYDLSIYAHPLFWVCLGSIVFYCGNFFLNGIYNYLVEIGSPLRITTHRIINNGLNCLMYGSFIISFLCSHRLKKYDILSSH